LFIHQTPSLWHIAKIWEHKRYTAKTKSIFIHFQSRTGKLWKKKFQGPVQLGLAQMRINGGIFPWLQIQKGKATTAYLHFVETNIGSTKENQMRPWEALYRSVYFFKSEEEVVPSTSEPLDPSGSESVLSWQLCVYL